MAERKLLRKKAPEKLRVPPEAFLAVQLDEIAGRLADIHEAIQRQVPEGLKEEVEVEVEGTTLVPVRARIIKPPYFRASVFNDGPDNVYVLLNKEKAEAYRQSPLKEGDKLDIDTTEGKIHALFFACESEDKTASIRVHLLK